MKVALVNPPWSFDGSVYYGCRHPHLPLELGYAKALLEKAGHDVLLADAQLGVTWRDEDEVISGTLDDTGLRAALADFRPDMTAITTAPSYLFWRCAPPELRVPMRTASVVREVAGLVVAVGPHASTTPRATLKKLGADVAVIGECEDIILRLAESPRSPVGHLSTVWLQDDELSGDATTHATDMEALPPLSWPRALLGRHRHHHHRFDCTPDGPGAEIEASRGCGFRKRPLQTVLDELDGLIAREVRYVYFIDEIFVPDEKLLDAVARRNVSFGVRIRIDDWSKPLLELLGEAGCVSIEAGVEATTAELTALLVHARKGVPFVQASVLDASSDDVAAVEAWRATLNEHGVWSNAPVPLFPYPGSSEYALRFGACDDEAWERAHAHYLSQLDRCSDTQDPAPRPLPDLEHESKGSGLDG